MRGAELEAWLRLGLVARLGPVGFRKILSSFGNPEASLGASQTAVEKIVGPEIAAAIAAGPDEELLARTLDWATDESNRCGYFRTDNFFDGRLASAERSFRVTEATQDFSETNRTQTRNEPEP